MQEEKMMTIEQVEVEVEERLVALTEAGLLTWSVESSTADRTVYVGCDTHGRLMCRLRIDAAGPMRPGRQAVGFPEDPGRPSSEVVYGLPTSRLHDAAYQSEQTAQRERVARHRADLVEQWGKIRERLEAIG